VQSFAPVLIVQSKLLSLQDVLVVAACGQV